MKRHRKCGGEVLWREPPREWNAHYERSGWCQKCDAFPIPIEDIIFSEGESE